MPVFALAADPVRRRIHLTARAGVAQLARAPAFQAGALPCNSCDDGNLSDRCAQHQQFPQQLSAEAGDPDPELQRIIDAWPTLPAAVKVGILAVVRAADGQGER